MNGTPVDSSNSEKEIRPYIPPAHKRECGEGGRERGGGKEGGREGSTKDGMHF